MAEFASKGVAGAGLGLGIAGTALGVLNGGIPNLLSGLTGMNRSCNSDDMPVNRYELAQQNTISELRSQIALRDANTYNDQKLLETYRYFDNKIGCIERQIGEQAVWNATQTGTISCIAQQVAQLQSLTKLVVPNTSVCPGWGEVTITPATSTTTTT